MTPSLLVALLLTPPAALHAAELHATPNGELGNPGTRAEYE